ncbi:putative F-box protein [Trichinella pseudospiralis]
MFNNLVESHSPSPLASANTWSSECWVQFFSTASSQMLTTLASAACGRRVVFSAGRKDTIVWSSFQYPASSASSLLDGVFPGGRTDFFSSPFPA